MSERRELEERFATTQHTLSCLTDRQLTILDRVCAGKPTKAIARELRVSKRLIELERSRLLRLFKVTASTEIAVRLGEYRAIKIFGLHYSEFATIPQAKMKSPEIQPVEHSIC